MWWEWLSCFGVGIIVGWLSYHFLIHKRQQKAAENSTAEKTLHNYEAAVHQHLMQTTELLQKLDADYQQVVEHLRHGIHDLGQSSIADDSIVPHFLFAHHSQKNAHDNLESNAMPKTYVDTKKKD